MSTIDLSKYAFSLNPPASYPEFEVHVDDSCFVFTSWEQASQFYQESLTDYEQPILIGVQHVDAP